MSGGDNDASDCRLLFDEALGLLDVDEPERALEIGQRLEAMQWTGGFEIQALALAQIDRREDTIETLRRGVDLAGGPATLWELLGNYLSDAERYAEACQAYDEAEKLDHNPYSLAYNRAMAMSRAGREEEAPRVLGAADRPSGDWPEMYRWLVRRGRWGVLLGLDRHHDVIAEFAPVQAAFEAWDNTGTGEADDNDMIAATASHVAIASYHDGDLAAARKWNAVALRRSPGLDGVGWLIRELRGEYATPETKQFAVTMEGLCPDGWIDDPEPRGFFRNFTVLADSVDEAVGYIADFEPAEIRGSTRVSETEVTAEWAPGWQDLPKGVYEVSGYFFYGLRAEDDED
jgi:tetratricopeptide (TPR) repeat protein